LKDIDHFPARFLESQERQKSLGELRLQRHIEDQIRDGCDDKTHHGRKKPPLLLDDSQEEKEKKQRDDNKTQPFHEQGIEKKSDQNESDLGHFPFPGNGLFHLTRRPFSEGPQDDTDGEQGDEEARPEKKKTRPRLVQVPEAQFPGMIGTEHGEDQPEQPADSIHFAHPEFSSSPVVCASR
jgi:hypothetical protein